MASVHLRPAPRVLWAVEAIVVVVALYFGRPILVPLALALLLTFLLTPAVSALERRGLNRVLAVSLVVLVIFCGSALVIWKTAEQLSDLVLNLPTYRQNLHDKIQSVKGSENRTLEALEKTVSEAAHEIEKTSHKAQQAAHSVQSRRAADGASGLPRAGPQLPGARRGPDGPTAVRLVPEQLTPLSTLELAFSAIAAPLAQAGLVTVLVIFMLAAREDLRNRFVRLAGIGRITLTTRTLDEVATRISRYLVMNALVNGGFGLVVGSFLYALGVHYAILWGFMAAVLRFVPYLGTTVATVLPVGMALIQFPSWSQPACVAAMFLLLELVTNSVIEPLTYGKSGGVSAVALLLAAIFWSWIWGPVGLLLSVPLTVVLAVLGKYVPPLEPLWILLGDNPPLPPHSQLYQRLLAGDPDEAADIVEQFARDHTRLQVYDELLIPVLTIARRDRERDEIPEAQQQFVGTTIQQLAEELDDAEPPAQPAAEADDMAPARTVLVVGVPAADRSDEVALEMLTKVAPRHIEFHCVPLLSLASELVDMLAESPPQLVCISALGNGGLGQTRYLCKRIRQRFANISILAGRWSYEGDTTKMAASLRARGASQVVTSLAEAVDALERVQPLATPVPRAS